MVERFIRTFKTRLERYFTESNRVRWVDIYEQISEAINNSVNRSIVVIIIQPQPFFAIVLNYIIDPNLMLQVIITFLKVYHQTKSRFRIERKYLKSYTDLDRPLMTANFQLVILFACH